MSFMKEFKKNNLIEYKRKKKEGMNIIEEIDRHYYESPFNLYESDLSFSDIVKSILGFMPSRDYLIRLFEVFKKHHKADSFGFGTLCWDRPDAYYYDDEGFEHNRYYEEVQKVRNSFIKKRQQKKFQKAARILKRKNQKSKNNSFEYGCHPFESLNQEKYNSLFVEAGIITEVKTHQLANGEMPF